MEQGAWGMVRGAWCMMHAAWCIMHGCENAQCNVHGVWKMPVNALLPWFH